jgi:hypothetical protein
MILKLECQAMSGRNDALGTPNTIFRAPLVAPPMESVSISTEELAPGTGNAMGLEEEILRERCAYDARVAEAAYFLAQRRGFEPGREVDDWVAAEVLVANATKHLDSASQEPVS